MEKPAMMEYRHKALMITETHCLAL
jgi:hypothetical protein